MLASKKEYGWFGGNCFMQTDISKKNWLLIWILGLAGQLCWNVENAWFSTFVYNKIAPDPSIISCLVGLSAVVTTFCTFFIGTWSDRIGRRNGQYRNRPDHRSGQCRYPPRAGIAGA